jgi:hypothetical protein
MHMYAAAIDALPDPSDPEFPDRAGVIIRRPDGYRGQRAGRHAGPAPVHRARQGEALHQASGQRRRVRKDLIEAVEAEEPVLGDEASRIKDLIAALGG